MERKSLFVDNYSQIIFNKFDLNQVFDNKKTDEKSSAL